VLQLQEVVLVGGEQGKKVGYDHFVTLLVEFHPDIVFFAHRIRRFILEIVIVVVSIQVLVVDNALLVLILLARRQL